MKKELKIWYVITDINGDYWCESWKDFKGPLYMTKYTSCENAQQAIETFNFNGLYQINKYFEL